MKGPRRIQIGVMGSANEICSKKAYRMAFEVGREIAKKGCILITGGGGGVMKAASHGADLEDGITVGILPGDKKVQANRYVDIAIPTGIGFARNLMNINSSHGIIIIEGGAGTMCEALHAYSTNTPAIALVGSGGTADMIAGKSLDQRGKGIIYAANSPKQAVDSLIKIIKKNRKALFDPEQQKLFD
jgi:uncharacterized protein (TIGR00725 family)